MTTTRADELIQRLQLQPHPEGGHYRELFRSPAAVQPGDGRAPRAALTTIDFLLRRGERSAWHQVASDEVWHLLEGGPLTLVTLPPTLDRIVQLRLQPVGTAPDAAPRHVVPAGWWQAAEPQGEFAYVGATVGPGFDFADFRFGRDDPALRGALARLAPERLGWL